MQISRIDIRHFRNVHLHCEPHEQTNFIIGRNGKGKSNFIDCLNIIASGKSFKKSANQDNITWEQLADFAKISCHVNYADDTNELSCVISNQPERVTSNYFLNNKKTLRKNVVGKLKCVLFTPQTLDLVIGTPSLRRDELDQFLCVLDNNNEITISEYSKVVRNRNKVLQRLAKGMGQKEELYYWTEKLLENAELVINLRLEVIDRLLPVLDSLSEKIFNSQVAGLNFSYASKLPDQNGKVYREALAIKIKENIDKEIITGRSLYGPHRDDLDFLLGQESIQLIGSRGQQRLAAIVFKLAQWHLLFELFGEKPVLLLDDVFSELDYTNRAILFNIVHDLGAQYFLTLVDQKMLPKEIDLSDSFIYDLDKQKSI